MSELEVIDQGALSNLTNLKVLECVQNHHLKIIHEHAFCRPGAEDPSRMEYPLIQELYLHNNKLSYLDDNILCKLQRSLEP